VRRRYRRQHFQLTCFLTLFRVRLHCPRIISLCEGGLHKFSGRPPVAGVENLEKEMQREFFDCDDPHITRIITSNYGRFETDLKTEWEFVVSPIKDKIYPGQEVCLSFRCFFSAVRSPPSHRAVSQGHTKLDPSGKPHPGRTPRALEYFLKHPMAKKAKLNRVEVMGLRFYTGPAVRAQFIPADIDCIIDCGYLVI